MSAASLTEFLLARGQAKDVERIAELRAQVEALPSAADRALLHPVLDLALRVHVAAYADHPDYREEWRA